MKLTSGVQELIIGSTGIGAVEIVEQSISSGVGDTGSIINVVIQIVIGIFTLFGLFKKQKNKFK